MDDIESYHQIETLKRCAVRYQALKKFEADLSRIVADINGNLVKLNPKN